MGQYSCAYTCCGIRVYADCFVFFFQAEDGIRDLVRSRGLGDVYKRQGVYSLSVDYTGDVVVEVTGGTYTDEATNESTQLLSLIHI